MSVLGEKV